MRERVVNSFGAAAPPGARPGGERAERDVSLLLFCAFLEELAALPVRTCVVGLSVLCFPSFFLYSD